jgi:hypothetical protein
MNYLTKEEVIEIIQNQEWDVMQNTIDPQKLIADIQNYKSSQLEPPVMPNEVVGGGLIAHQLNDANKDFLRKKFGHKGLNLIVASHNQSLQYAKIEDGKLARNADYGDWITEFNGRLFFLKEYDSRREA